MAENEDNESDTDIIFKLSKRSFSDLTLTQQIEIIQTGRPTPALKDLKTVIKSKGVVRTFNADLYNKQIWLCGSHHFRRLFCWPCLLFTKTRTIWSGCNQGYYDLNNVHTASQRHASLESHIMAFLDLKTFISTHIESHFDKGYEINVARHNEQVKNNRIVLKRFVATACLFGKQEIAFGGHNESNRGNFMETIYTISEFDDKLQNRLENTTELFRDIQNDLVDSIGETIIDEIKCQIQKAPFVCISLNETSEVTNFSQLSVVFRYIHKGECVESFVGFYNVGANRSAESISILIFDRLTQFGCENKLIAQIYDGAAVMVDQLNAVQARVKVIAPEALFVHYYNHGLNLVLSQAVSYIKECKFFFATLNGLVEFFSHSSNRTQLLYNIDKKQLSKEAFTCYSDRLVETVFECKSDLIALFETVLENADKWDQNTLREASGYLYTLNDSDFNFLLRLFYEIYPHTEHCFDLLQSKDLDISSCTIEIDVLKEKLQTGRDWFFNQLWSFMEEGEFFQKKKSSCLGLDDKETIGVSYREMFIEIVDCLIIQIDSRFKDLKHLQFLTLLDKTKYSYYVLNFPQEELNSLKATYGKYFDFARLSSELRIYYKNETLNSLNLKELFLYLSHDDYNLIMPQLWLLSAMILTIPATSVSVQNSVSSLKRIQTYLKNSMGQEKSPALALMSIGKDILCKLENKEDFYDRVISKFCSKTQKVEFNYI